MRIIMVRHGISLANEKRIYSPDDIQLSEIGKEGLLKTKDLLKNFTWEKSFSSPLNRAIETSEILGLNDYELDSRIQEMNFGKYKGVSFLEVRTAHREEMVKWKTDDTHIVTDGESRFMVYKRVVDFLDEKVEKGEDILMVTHEGVIRLAFSWALGSMSHYYRFKIQNASINIIEIVNGKSFITKVNYI